MNVHSLGMLLITKHIGFWHNAKVIIESNDVDFYEI